MRKKAAGRPLFAGNKLFHLCYNNTSAQDYQPVSLHLVKDPAHLEAAVAHLIGQPRHEYVEGFGASGIDTVLPQEAHDALGERCRRSMPLLAQQLLRLGGKDVEQVKTEDEELLTQTVHLVLADGDETAFGEGYDGVSESLLVAIDSLGLQLPGGAQVLHHLVGTVVGAGFGLKGAREQEEELAAGIVGTHHGLACCHLKEAELSMAGNQRQIVAAHALKQGELQKVVVEYLVTE